MSTDPRASGWVGHLRSGGTTPWPVWIRDPSAGDAAGNAAGNAAGAGELPGAAQLELLRRLNEAGAVRPELAERVLRRAAPGRGLIDRVVTDPPDGVPERELLRVGSGVLADLVMELEPVVHHEVRRPWSLTGEPSFVLEGPPLTVSRLRADLAALGLHEHGSPAVRRLRRTGRPEVALVVTAPLPRALFEVWSHRAQQGSPRHWPTVIAEWRGSGQLPAGAAYDRLAAHWAGLLGSGRVHVLTRRGLREQVHAVLGGSHRIGRVRLTGVPTDLRPVLVDVLRLANQVLAFKAPEPGRKPLVDRLLPILGQTATTGPARLGLPVEHRRWAARTGTGIADRLGAGGYPVHGRLTGLGRADGDPGVLEEAQVLSALLEVVLRVDRQVVGDRLEETGAASPREGHG